MAPTLEDPPGVLAPGAAGDAAADFADPAAAPDLAAVVFEPPACGAAVDGGAVVVLAEPATAAVDDGMAPPAAAFFLLPLPPQADRTTSATEAAMIPQRFMAGNGSPPVVGPTPGRDATLRCG